MRRLRDVDVTTLLTLTCNPAAYSDRDTAFRAMSVSVNHLVKRIRRRWSSADLQYFLVWERTAKGWPHAHLLLRAPFIPQAWLASNWHGLTGARVIDIRKIASTEAVASYVAKYLAKDPFVPTGMKRYRFSQGFLAALVSQPPDGAQGKIHWRLAPNTAHAIAQSLSLAGATAQAHADGSYTLFPPGYLNAPAYDSLSMFPPAAPAAVATGLS